MKEINIGYWALRVMVVCAVTPSLWATEATKALALEKSLEQTIEESIVKSIEKMLGSDTTFKALTGLKCHSMSQFFANEGIDDVVREQALLSIKTSLRTELSGDCNVEVDLSAENILSLKTIPVDDLMLRSKKVIGDYPHLEGAVNCLQGKTTKKLYLAQIRETLEKLWSKNLSREFKSAIISEIFAQNPGVTLTVEMRNGWLAHPVLNWGNLANLFKQSRFCFADIVPAKGERAETYLVSAVPGHHSLTVLKSITLADDSDGAAIPRGN
jgi:hypothetical protein